MREQARDLQGEPRLEGATRVRYVVVVFAVLLAIITYLDRACISVLKSPIASDLKLTDIQMGYVFSAFALAYAIFEIPTAWWADREGTRHVLTRIVCWWSTFTMATAGALNYSSLLVIRFLFGAGEAGAWPTIARTFSRWLPRCERGRVQGIFFAGAHLGGGVTPMMVLWLIQFIHWRVVFLLFGLFGLVWAAVWHVWFRNDPSEKQRVNEAELSLIMSDRQTGGTHHASWAYWKRLFGHRNMLPLCTMYFPNSFAFYFCITWLPTYLKEKHGLEAASLGLFAGLPLLLSVFGDIFGGLATDWGVSRFGLRWGRVGVGAAAYIVAGAAMLLAGVIAAPSAAATLIAVSTAASMLTLGAAWGTCIDVGGDHPAVVSAAMNTSGQIGALICPVLVIHLVRRYGEWNAPLYLMGVLFLVGAVSWLFVDPRKQVFD
jgi:ACS family glucarate transporter-like MFS transporter